MDNEDDIDIINEMEENEMEENEIEENEMEENEMEDNEMEENEIVKNKSDPPKYRPGNMDYFSNDGFDYCTIPVLCKN